MKTFQVFHHVSGNFLLNISEMNDLENNYTCVASVECFSLEDAFHLTNTIDLPWWKNKGVTPVGGKPGYRSTSVGDIIVDMKTKTAYMCDAVGWIKLDGQFVG